MSRVQIDLPEQFQFCTELDVLISQINLGNHLGNDSIVSILNEARLRYMAWLGYDAGSLGGFNYINADLAIIYKGEAHYADTLQVHVSTANFSKYGCDFLFRICNKSSGKDIAIAKAAFLLYDYQQQCLVKAPANFEELFNK